MLTIRPFAPTDIAAVTEVVQRSLGESYPPSLYLTIHNLWGEGFMVLVEDGRIIGFLAAVPTAPRIARILMLALLPERRSRSMGQRLMAEFYTKCLEKGYDTVVLEVRKSNGTAISFYEKQGFEITGDIENFYSNGEGAFKMMKVLQS
jgi:ribosomal protein S18 acetylase RimI-like enzyme